METITYGGQVYNTVLIGDQCWLKENLNYGAGYSWCYDNDTANCNTYGRLYDWQTAQNVCPSGWQLPSNVEWAILTDFLGGLSVAGGKMKEVGNAHWAAPNTGATNSSGFTALPGGYRDFNASFHDKRNKGNWWTSNSYGVTGAGARFLFYNDARVATGSGNKALGYSVRCLKNN